MKTLLRSLIAGTLIFCSLSAAAEEYLYSGTTYTSAAGIYTTSMRLTGTIETSSPIPSNAINLNITALIDSFTFNDGVNTLTEANGSLAGFNIIPGVLVSTDADGEIIDWIFIVRDLPIADMVGETNLLMASSSDNGDGATPVAECTSINLVPTCLTYDSSPPGNSASAPTGSWSKQLKQGQPVPTLTAYSLALTALGLLVLGTRRLRRRS